MLQDSTPAKPREEAQDSEELQTAQETPRSALQRLAEDVYSFPGDGNALSEDENPQTLPSRTAAKPSPLPESSKKPTMRELSYPHPDVSVDDVELNLPAVQPPETTPVTCCQELAARFDWSFWLSILSVACWSLAGNASRLALHNALLSVSFMPTYNMFGPNCVGSFAIGFFSGVFPEKYVPVTCRALTVGFCGAFTTLSTWVYDVANHSQAGPAIEEVISGVTMPFIFCVWGRDVAWRLACFQRACHRRSNLTSPPEPPVHEDGRPARRCSYAKAAYLGVDIVFLIVSIMAAVGIPIAMHFDRIAPGSTNPITTQDLYMVVLAPAGAVVRYILGVLLNKYTALRGFPLGTFISNVLGTVLFVVMENMMRRRPGNEWYGLVANGIAGSFTTVSSLVNEAIELYTKKQVTMAYFYALLTCGVTIGIAAIARRETYKIELE